LAFDTGVAVLTVVVLLALTFYLMSLRATLIRMSNEAARALSNLEAHLKQRNALIPTLIETCRGYMGTGEVEVQAVASARIAFSKATSLADKAACEQAVRQNLSNLFRAVERHHDLRINNNYQKLRARFAEFGREIDSYRQLLNDAVDRYNRGFGAFPASWFGRWLGMKPKSHFELPESGGPRIADL
jgi:LemA protein